MLLGLSMKTFWEEINPKQFLKYLEVYEGKEKNRAKEIDMNNYILGKYVGMAVNASSKHPYPSKPFLADDIKPKEMTSEEMERFARKFTRQAGGKIIDKKQKDGIKS